MKRKGKQGPKRMPEAVALVDRDQAGDIILHHLHTTLPGALWKAYGRWRKLRTER